MQNYHGFQEFKQKISVLIGLIERQIEVLEVLNKPTQVANLNFLKGLVQSSSFKVMVLGEFKRGKSTFINALLGEEILPAYSTPCTAIINEVKWSDRKNAILHFNKSEDNELKSPLNIPIDEIEEYVVIKEESDQSQAINESPYEKLELFWPIKLCENGVEIIDSPGLNEHKTRQQITEGYLATVDAILLVLSCEQLFSKSEQEVVTNKLKPMGHEDIFFICNRINMIRKNEIDKVKNYAFNKLSPLTRLGAERVFFINALGGLDGKINNDTEALEQSGVPKLEAELQNFLTNDRGRVKILRPAQELKNSIRETRKSIPEQASMLQTDVSELEQRVTAAQEPLKLLEGKRQNIVRTLDISIEDTKEQVNAKVKIFCRELAPKIKNIATEYKLTTEVKLLFKDPRPSIEAATKEIACHLESQIETEFANWQRSELEPLLAKKIESMKNSLENETSEFIESVDNLRLEISGISIANVEISKEDVGVKKVSNLERVLSAAGGLLIGGVGSAAIGARFGYNEMLKSLIPQIGVGMIGVLLLGLNPVTIVPIIVTMIIAGIVQGKFMETKLGEKIKEEVGKRFVEQMNNTTDAISNNVNHSVAAELNKIKNLVDEGLGAEIQNIREQVDNVLADKQKGQSEVDKKLWQLQALAEDINKIDRELDDLIAEVAISGVSH
jgi:GTPase Era involved in 16S rRNA processing